MHIKAGDKNTPDS